TPGFEARDGRVTAALAAGVHETSWQSRLERGDRLELRAAELAQRAETWRVTVSPQWRVELSGVPAAAPAAAEDYWVHEFHPLPGETLTLSVSRPDPVAGATLAIDRATVISQVGRRAGEHTLTVLLRSTRGGQHPLTLPADAEVLEVKVDGAAVNLRPEQGRLTVPIHPGSQHLVVRWRDPRGARLSSRVPAIDLGASASNLGLVLKLPQSRWVLATAGPRVGPAVLYWGELLVLALVALLLSRLGQAPLTFHQWLLLGLGFSTFSWVALTVVVAWLLVLDLRGRLKEDLPWWRFDLVQLALVGFTLVALGCLVAAVPYGLLGSPDMRVDGNGSSAYDLRWFADQTAGPLPAAAALSLPLWVYRLAMLAWALWLATAVVGWLRWGWQCLTTGGGWKRPPRVTAPAPVPPPARAPHEQS
ncbi:MAG: hypothetical protein V1750_11260, partial [Acidobacteriota bacterium]